VNTEYQEYALFSVDSRDTGHVVNRGIQVKKWRPSQRVTRDAMSD